MKEENKRFSTKNLIKNGLRVLGISSWPAILATSIGLCAGYAVAASKLKEQFKETKPYQTELAKVQMEVDTLEKNYLEVKTNYEKGDANLKQLETAKNQYERQTDYVNSNLFTLKVMETTAPELYEELTKDSMISFFSGVSIVPEIFPGTYIYAYFVMPDDSETVLSNFDHLYVEDDKKEKKIAKLKEKLDKLQSSPEKA